MASLEKRLQNINAYKDYRQSITDLDEIKFFGSKIHPQKSTDLPQIKSPFLKKTVLNLFPLNHSSKLVASTLSPIKKYNPQKQLRKSHQQYSAIQSKLLQQKSIKVKHNAPHQSTISKQKIMNVSDLKRKSFSESKYMSNCLIRKNSTQQIGMGEHVRNAKGNSNSNHSRKKMITEDSNRQQAKPLYQKLHQLNQKEKSHEINSKWIQSQTKQQLKASNFVTKHKLHKELYKIQKDQIKYVKTFLNNGLDVNLTSSIKIKNYINFFPTS